MRKKRKGVHNGAPRCPYCGSHTILRSADGIYQNNSKGVMLYVCKNYPACDSYVRAHSGTNIPMGIPANWKLRKLRNDAHHYFNQLYQRGYMTKQDAYCWLADILCVPYSEAHIGYLGEYYCQKVIEESQKVLAKHKDVRKGKKQNHTKGGKQYDADRQSAARC